MRMIHWTNGVEQPSRQVSRTWPIIETKQTVCCAQHRRGVSDESLPGDFGAGCSQIATLRQVWERKLREETARTCSERVLSAESRKAKTRRSDPFRSRRKE